ncbi:lipase 3-like [Temnothorax nylanderi]|uniref:lipase 3-like n=1 Tax=Temnothorax nylanderi TaxID=102681 RepID=UPI003A8C140F
MITSDMKSMFLAFLIIMTFSESEGRLQSILSVFLNEFLNFFFPKDPGLVRVRRMDRVEEMMSGKILDCVGLVERYNYPAEEHNVTTEDGYNLKIHRIPGSPLSDNKKKKEIIFMQHGLLASSDSWVLLGPGKDLAFLLTDQGYDVWIGNVRGNSYGRSHVNMTTYDPKFWQYSFHEIGTKDLPAMFDYILNYTKRKDLYYIGHSMGGTTLLTLLSTKPEYNIKIKMAICLAPASFWIKVTPIINEVANIYPILMEVLREREIYDFLPQSLATVTLLRILCKDNTMTQIICVTVLFLIAGSDPPQLNTTILPDLFSYFPAGTSTQTLDHFFQNIRINDFRNYDYGIAENYKRYKQKTPPSYDLKKIIAPIILFYATNDMLVTDENVLELGKHLPNVLLTEKVPFKLFNHIDYVIAINVKTLLYDRVLELIQRFDTDQNKSPRRGRGRNRVKNRAV